MSAVMEAEAPAAQQAVQPRIEINDVSLRYFTDAGETQALDRIRLTVAPGEFVSLIGQSGCGKSTLLRTIAGLEEADDGRIEIGGELVNHLPPRDRDIAMVFQNYALYPYMKVFDNIAFGLR
jgi:ABC-type sugar transport system ATPase subunit